jgi:hypothetical protein
MLPGEGDFYHRNFLMQSLSFENPRRNIEGLPFFHAACSFFSAGIPCRAVSTSGISFNEMIVENPLRNKGKTQMKKLRTQKLEVLSLLGSR